MASPGPNCQPEMGWHDMECPLPDVVAVVAAAKLPSAPMIVTTVTAAPCQLRQPFPDPRSNARIASTTARPVSALLALTGTFTVMLYVAPPDAPDIIEAVS